MSLPLTRLLCYLRRAAAPARADSDADLLGRFVRRRDEDAFAALVARHGPMVLHACRRILGDVDAAEDAFQATFLVLARRAASVGRPAALAGWLYGVAARVAREARRRDARQPRPGPAEAPEPPDPRPDPLSELTARDLLAVLEQEVRRLPEAYRLPVVLCCLEGLSQEEAARRLGCSAAAVRGRLERGRRRLHDRLAKRGLGLPAALGAAEAARGAPGVLSEAAARAAARFAAGETSAAKVISPRVVALTEGVLRAMLLTRLHTAVTLLLVLGLAGLACGALLGRKADNPGRATAPPPGGAEDPARPPGVRPEPPDEAKAKPAEEGPTAYVRVEAKGTLVRTDKGYAVRAKDAVFPDVTVLVYLERGEDKNRALDDHLRSLEGKAVIVTGFLDGRRLDGARGSVDVHVSEVNQVRAVGASGEREVAGFVERITEEGGTALVLRGVGPVAVDEKTQYLAETGRDVRQASLGEMLHKQVYAAVEKRGDKLYARLVVIRLLQPAR